MQIIRGIIDAPLHITAAVEVQGIIRGAAGVRVGSGAVFLLRGTCETDIVVEPGARAELWGIVEGTVTNQGGDVRVFGIVKGQIARLGGTTSCSSDSRIEGGFAP